MSITISSRKNKGRRFQQWVAKQVSNILGIPWGKDELIRSREGGQAGTDIVLLGEAKTLFPYSVECKAQESWSVHEWIKQAKSNQEKGTEWLLFAKRNNETPVVIMDADTFFNLCKGRGDKNGSY